MDSIAIGVVLALAFLVLSFGISCVKSYVKNLEKLSKKYKDKPEMKRIIIEYIVAPTTLQSIFSSMVMIEILTLGNAPSIVGILLGASVVLSFVYIFYLVDRDMYYQYHF
ncbi:hypothetical protein BG262_02780 [Floricoccus penangensis]|uniref:Uncharacterized protein n=1 Tax=Floricoccus penangensis TaxID=1859475 RepID=A0A9Q5JG96_9LACT|nr:hypothetical protein [Floricoccus penangensis]OFI46740.1 hypothetical protein BG262_02780 [Floricoccus penangensis]